MSSGEKLRYLEDRWQDDRASELDGPDLLRYRSNLLGSDLRITNFGGGNTSAKLVQSDPLDGTSEEVLWIKGSGGDLGSIQRGGFATLYMRKLKALRHKHLAQLELDFAKGIEQVNAARRRQRESDTIDMFQNTQAWITDTLELDDRAQFTIVAVLAA